VCREQNTKPNLVAKGSDGGLQDGQVGDHNRDELLADGPLAAGDGAFWTGLELMSAVSFYELGGHH
jgi:hypothetical protein